VQFAAGRTAVVIAHRLSTIATDLICVLQDGQIVEQVSMRVAGAWRVYTALYNSQFAG
jgi:ABC-type transport system involved in Fe-S cluster assembly fused permease/ATPase subunit